jgi:hypothetical protein
MYPHDPHGQLPLSRLLCLFQWLGRYLSHVTSEKESSHIRRFWISQAADASYRAKGFIVSAYTS